MSGQLIEQTRAEQFGSAFSISLQGVAATGSDRQIRWREFAQGGDEEVERGRVPVPSVKMDGDGDGIPCETPPLQCAF